MIHPELAKIIKKIEESDLSKQVDFIAELTTNNVLDKSFFSKILYACVKKTTIKQKVIKDLTLKPNLVKMYIELFVNNIYNTENSLLIQDLVCAAYRTKII